MSVTNAGNHPSGIESFSLDDALQRAANEAQVTRDVAPLVKWARSQGEIAAISDLSVQTVVERVMRAVDAIDGLEEADGLPATLVGAIAEGYVQAKSSTAHDAANDTNLQDRLAELTALHRINSAANSSLKLTD